MIGTTSTANISTDEEVLEAIAYMNEHAAKIGRTTPPHVILSSTYAIKQGFSAQEALDTYAHFKELGAVGSGASIDAQSRAEWIDLALQFGEQVISKVD